MGCKAIFLDRDGTINVDKHYVGRPEDFTLLPGVPEALRSLTESGYRLIVITNQSGVARGYYTEADVQALNRRMCSELKAYGVQLDGVYYCPHHPEGSVAAYRRRCDCRKPGLGLFMQAVQAFDIDLSRSYAIGDRLRDCALCERTACRGFLVGENESEELLCRVRAGAVPRVRWEPDLYACARQIKAEERERQGQQL